MLDEERRRGRRAIADRTAGNGSPMSPSPIAPSRASVMAWRTTSASLWPSRPRSCGTRTPPSQTCVARREGVDVEAQAGAADQPRREALLGAGEIGFVGELLERSDRPRPIATSIPAARAIWASSVAAGRSRRGGRRGWPRGGRPAESGPAPGPSRVDRRRQGSRCPRERIDDRQHRHRRRVRRSSASTSRSTTAGGAKGRAASWISTRLRRPPPRSLRGRSAPTPAAPRRR